MDDFFIMSFIFEEKMVEKNKSFELTRNFYLHKIFVCSKI